MGGGVPYLTFTILNLLRVARGRGAALDWRARLKIPLVFVG
jgi:hypothetical protein